MADPVDIAHLLRRTEFVAKPGRVADLSAMTITQAVDDVLNVSLNANPAPPAALLVDDEQHRRDQLSTAYHWWIDAMVSRARPIQEKMTLFWHGHFTSGIDDVGRVDLMMRQNQLYRSEGMGNLLSLTHKMAIEPAMLVYLSGANNVKGAPNENFARELMELFTLGVGNYSEDDVAASARAWTGHNSIDGTYVFIPTRHDTKNKTFFGTTKNWDGPDIIDEILRDNAAKRQVAARNIARKLWEFFAYPGPDTALLDALTATFIAGNLEIAPLLRDMFNRAEFYSATAKQGLVRTPTEYSVALCLHTASPAKDLALSARGEAMGQELLNPPNVAGWKANSYWLNTSSLSGRAVLARDVTTKLRKNGGFDDLAAMTVVAAVDAVASYFGLSALSTVSRDGLVAGYQADRTFPKNLTAANNLLTAMMLTPEFHTG